MVDDEKWIECQGDKYLVYFKKRCFITKELMGVLRVGKFSVIGGIYSEAEKINYSRDLGIGSMIGLIISKLLLKLEILNI